MMVQPILQGGDDAGLNAIPSWARIWSLETGECIREFEHNRMVNDASFSPDGTLVVTACSDDKVRIWNVSSGECMHTIQGSACTSTFSSDC